MACNYIEYQRMTNSLFFGVALTDKHMNEATEHIRRYFINGGALEIVNALGIGIRVTGKCGGGSIGLLRLSNGDSFISAAKTLDGS